jgi:oxygen-independent coproporphyrinogen-3 oxidase
LSGIYLHIPFCKQACHYCDFHFSTSLAKKEDIVNAIAKELVLRKNEISLPIETIYFGGGTPSLLSVSELRFLITTIYETFDVIDNPEITLEANPDDLMPLLSSENNSESIFIKYRSIGINRLSIGIQSFYEDDLKMMNRAHNAKEASHCLLEATRFFDNITIDLIYGIPGMSNEKWVSNIEKSLSYGVNHISSYALTVEPKTALESFIKKGVIEAPKDDVTHEHFQLLVKTLETNGFVHYELSNFGKPNYFSKHNTSYWLGKPYLGIGPSAHSFNGTERAWNVANNTQYVKKLQDDILPITRETLTVNDRFNEYIMTGLRTIYGVSLDRIQAEFGQEIYQKLLNSSEKHISQKLLTVKENTIITTNKGKFLCDGIASDLFLVD